MHQVGAGTLGPAEARDVMFVASLPDTGAGAENGFMGAALAAAFDWTASESTAAPAPTPTPTATPTPTPTVTATPTATPAPAATPTPAAPVVTPAPTAAPPPPVVTPSPTPPPAAETPASLIPLPPATACMGPRKLTVKLRAPRGARISAVTVKVAKKVKRYKRRVAKVPVDLRSLTRGKVKVTITVTTTKGRVILTRTYKACAKKPVKSTRRRRR
jgi:hypothetical protein